MNIKLHKISYLRNFFFINFKLELYVLHEIQTQRFNKKLFCCTIKKPFLQSFLRTSVNDFYFKLETKIFRVATGF